MFKKEFFLSVAFACLMPSFCNANVVKVQDTSSKGVNVTVYNNGLGLVKDKREVSFKKGKNVLSFENVSAQIISESALFEGKNLKVLEQNFNFDLLSKDALLKKYLGKEIQVIDTHYLSGKKTVENAKVLSVDAGLVLKIGDRIETDYKGRLIFPEIPEDLYDKPTLTIETLSNKTATQDVKLSYLTNGLTWKADYVAELNEEEDALNLNGWVTLTNTSGIAYKKADIQFVAGSVNRVQPVAYRPRMLMTKNAMIEDSFAMGGEAMAEEELMDYHLYSLGRKTTIASNQTKQLSLMNASDVKIKKEYKIENLLPTYRYSHSKSDFETRNVDIVLNIENKKSSNLGVSLPAGIIRVYKADNKQNVFFVGEDKIKHTPENGKIKLSLGSAFDVTVSGKETAYTAFSKKSYEASYAIKFKNAKKEPIEILYEQDFSHDWTIADASIKQENSTARRAKWKVKVPAKGETVLTFTLRVKKP